MMIGGMLYVGTAGTSTWFSGDLGENWVRPNSASGLYLESRIWTLSSHPGRPDDLLAGTDMGLYRWSESGQAWTHMPSPMDGKCIWALTQAADDPDRIFAGTRPAELYGSRDGGKSWRKLNAPALRPTSSVNSGPTRVTQILFDPFDADSLWATVEINGVHRSRDGGENWELVDKGLISGDVHGIAILPGRDGGKTIFVTTNKGLHRSEDDGENWQFEPLRSDWQYTRAITPRADGKVLFLTNGNGPPGSTGFLLRSTDVGKTWEDVGLPGELNSTPWCVATNPADPDLLFVATNLGQLFRSEDGGKSWRKLRREFGEIRSLHWRPVRAPERWRDAWVRDGRAW
jgi:photosystem II stability/assembly factor-like uncharacterized protein